MLTWFCPILDDFRHERSRPALGERSILPAVGVVATTTRSGQGRNRGGGDEGAAARIHPDAGLVGRAQPERGAAKGRPTLRPVSGRPETGLGRDDFFARLG